MQLLGKVYIRLLALCARARLRGDARVVGITGSIGKTTTKDAVAHALSDVLHIVTKKSMNSAVGLPLTVLELSAPKRKVGYVPLLFVAIARAMRRMREQLLILEYGVDRAGDMDELLDIVRPTIGVFTAHAAVHIGEGNFVDEAALLREEGLLVTRLSEQDVAVLNADDAAVMSLVVRARTVTFGMREGATYRIRDVVEGEQGIRFVVERGGERVVVETRVLGQHMVYPLTAALAVASELGVPLAVAAKRLGTFVLPPGRGMLLRGKNGSQLIESSYNASPATMRASLALLAGMTGRRIALLGQMNELGPLSEKEHVAVGQEARRCADIVIGVHGQAALYAPDRFFETAEEAGVYVASMLRQGDTVLVKGSRYGVRLERASTLLLADARDIQYLPKENES